MADDKERFETSLPSGTLGASKRGGAIEQPSVLIKAGPARARAVPLAYTLRGSTANFDVYYDTNSGTAGPPLADAILAHCENDLAQLQAWFGRVAVGRFAIYIDPGYFGAYHASCAATEIHCAAFGGNNGDLMNLLNVAEVDEVMMANQGAGWNCGNSAGEGLSRVLATERYPAQLDGFASASTWLNSPRPDWVTNTEPTDRDYVSIGCSTLFINYLRYQLGFSFSQIVQAGGATLQQTYATLTGSNDAFGPFATLLERHFPAGTVVNLPNDNPFPFKMNIDAKLLGSTAGKHNVQITVTDGDPLSGVGVEIFYNITGSKSAGGVTGPNGVVILTYTPCKEPANGGWFEVGCPAKASKPGYQDVDFETPGLAL